ncbi:MAG TPA: PAS domain S-box protein [Devosiaceae bacterium]|jgi:PAS domain S-box-containing protein|nr:PAS domain S-box protein [Devosiaceae bacterium]
MTEQQSANAPATTASGAADWSVDEPKALLDSIIESSHDAIISKTLEGVVTSWNGAAQRIFGYAAGEMIGQHIGRLIPTGREHEEQFIIDRIRAGQRIDNFETMRQHKSGRLIAISLTVAPVHGADGRFIGVSKIARDISEQKRLEEAKRLLDREVNHRSKNLLAVVDSIIRQTAGHSSAENFTHRITQRLRALAANQDLLIEASWRGAEMQELVYSQLVHIDGLVDTRVSLSGEPLVVTPVAAQALGMAIHELALNALVFGALSSPEGRVAVAWRVDEADAGPELVVTWKETGGPAVTRPERTGFGTTIIERITGQALGGRVSVTYAPSGLQWEVRAPAGGLVATGLELPAPSLDAAGQSR